MAEEAVFWRRPRFWIWLVAIVILLLFAYFYQPLEIYIVENVPKTTFATVIFWFVSLVAVVAYGVAHAQSFRHNIVRASNSIQVDTLVLDTLQITMLAAVILCAGATLQAVERLSEYVMSRGEAASGSFADRLLVILLFVILTIIFYLLHLLVRAFRVGWHPRRAPPRPGSAGQARAAAGGRPPSATV